MTTPPLQVTTTPEGVRLSVRVQPRASRTGVQGVQNGQLKVRLCSPPAEGRANRELTELLARLLGVSRSSVELIRGTRGRSKLIDITGDPALLRARLRDVVAGEVE